MSVDLQARVILSPQLEAALRQSKLITTDELEIGMTEATEIVKAEVRQNIQSEGLVKTGRLIKSVRSRVVKGGGAIGVRGIVDVGARGRGKAFYAIALEQGATIVPKNRTSKKGKPRNVEYLVLRFQDYGIITHVGGNALKRERTELLGVRFAKVKKVTLKPRRFFVTAVDATEPKVLDSMQRATDRAMRRIFEGR